MLTAFGHTKVCAVEKCCLKRQSRPCIIIDVIWHRGRYDSHHSFSHTTDIILRCDEYCARFIILVEIIV